MQENEQNLIYRIQSLEKTVGTLNTQVNDQTAVIQTTADTATAKPIATGQHNLVRNGDFDLDRNRYIYATDFTGSGGVDADVSEEAAYWFTALPDTAIESSGAIAASSATLTIADALFVSADAGKEIVVEGAGAAGADLITTISGTPASPTTATLSLAASMSVTDARVRWRLRALLEDSTDMDADANQATNSALKTPAHSRYAASGIINDPDYDKSNGWSRTGSANWLCAPMPKNYFKPSTAYIVTFIYQLKEAVAGATSLAVTPFAGLWDNSPGRRQFLEGKPIAVTAEVRGTPAATVSREYFIVFYTNWGDKIGSQKVIVPNAPADGAFITNSIYIYLSWAQPRGIVRTEIYRKTGAVYKLVGLPVQSGFRDTNGTAGVPQEPQATVSSYPAVNYTRPLAMIKTTATNFSPAQIGVWQQAQLSIAVPFDYDVSKLTDKQWLVLGLPAAAPNAHLIYIDKISVDDKYGVFSISALDELAKRGLSSTPVSGNQGNPGGIYISPGYTGCPTFEMPILIETADGERFEVPAIDLVNNIAKHKIVNRRMEAVGFSAKVSRIKQAVYEAAANDRKLRASESHPSFIDFSDVTGKPLREMICGDTILTVRGVERLAYNIRQLVREYTVEFSLDSEEKGFWVNGYGGHNRKIDPSPDDPNQQ